MTLLGSVQTTTSVVVIEKKKKGVDKRRMVWYSNKAVSAVNTAGRESGGDSCHTERLDQKTFEKSS